MAISLIAVGKLKNSALRDLAHDYGSRIKRLAKLEMAEIRDSDPERESERLAEALKARSGPVFLLAEEGKTRSSVEFADMLQSMENDAVFVVAGAYGPTNAFKASVDELFSLSPMTFPHEIARVLLLEQIYRALSIQVGSSYHHS